ncbi:hypothetical protein [Burkholderia cenocepacia]|uniref:hypothetical protein n=1 Tax=Burkholderia cenocepacia TaxID=95486 RepID=UPI002B24F0A4|nr:hypothetical protein [Burkholderia cenocepacia]MEB2554078.1 hypothetical protein [Burkholderia cenocepacia]
MKIEIKGFIVYGCFEHEARCGDQPYFSFKDYEPSNESFVTVRPETLSFDVPDDFDPRPQMVQRLKAEKERIKAEFQMRVTQIDAQIQSLQAIEA